MFSDREVLIGLFDLLAGLAERLTGERPTVRFQTEDGEWVNVCDNTGRVTWNRPCPHTDREAGQSTSRSPEEMHSNPSDSPPLCDMFQEHRKQPAQLASLTP